MNQGNIVAGSVLTVLAIVAIIAGLLFGVPVYSVWRAGKVGEAELRRAEQNKQIRIEEARAQMESAKMLASAEVERAKGVAEANQIIGASLKKTAQKSMCYIGHSVILLLRLSSFGIK